MGIHPPHPPSPPPTPPSELPRREPRPLGRAQRTGRGLTQRESNQKEEVRRGLWPGFWCIAGAGARPGGSRLGRARVLILRLSSCFPCPMSSYQKNRYQVPYMGKMLFYIIMMACGGGHGLSPGSVVGALGSVPDFTIRIGALPSFSLQTFVQKGFPPPELPFQASLPPRD